jgi:MFS family permease
VHTVTPLRKNRAFIIFLIGQVVSFVGDGVLLLAMPLLVLETTGAVAQMGLVTATIGVGQMLGGVLAGQLVDRFDRRLLMLAMDIARLALYALVPIIWQFAQPVWLLYLVALLSSVLGTSFFVAQLTAVPSLVAREQLTPANGAIMVGYGASMFLGPLLAGVLSGAIGTAMTVGLDALTFLVSAVSLLFIRFRPPDTKTLAAQESEATDDAQSRFASVRFLWQQPVLRAVALLMMGVSILVAGGHDLLIYHLKANLGQDDRMVGVVFGTAAGGAMLGGLLSTPMRTHMGLGKALASILLFQGVVVIVMGVATSVFVVGCTALGFGMASAGAMVHTNSIRQELSPDHLLGRVTSIFSVLTSGVGMVGAAGATFLAQAIGVSNVLMLIGAGLVSLGILGALSALGRAR